MEGLQGDLNSRVISAWDFLHQGHRTPLTDHVIERAQGDLQIAFETLLDRRERDRRRKQFAACLVVWIVLGCTPWFAFGRVSENLHRSWIAARDYFFPVAFSLEPEPGTHIHRLNDQVALGLHLSRPGDLAVKLVSQIDDAPPTETPVTLDQDGSGDADHGHQFGRGRAPVALPIRRTGNRTDPAWCSRPPRRR